MAKETIQVEGMSCGHCSQTVEGALVKLDGVNRALVSLEDNHVVVEFDESKISVEKLKKQIEEVGYEVK